MNIRRIYALVLRHFYNLRRSFDRLSDVFYWPVLDLILWGLTGVYFASLSPNSTIHIEAVIGAILLWVIPWRAQNEISINVLVELWDRNLTNIFVAPLKFSEWATALMIVGVFKGIISLSFGSLIAFLLFRVDIFMYGWYLLPFLMMLFIFGWSIGFTVASVVLRFGSRIQTLGWTVPWAAAPFSAIYFPVVILPHWAQGVSKALPSSYIFEGSRQILFQHSFNWNYFWIAFILNIIYFTLSITLFRASYKKALSRGLQGIN